MTWQLDLSLIGEAIFVGGPLGALPAKTSTSLLVAHLTWLPAKISFHWRSETPYPSLRCF